MQLKAFLPLFEPLAGIEVYGKKEFNDLIKEIKKLSGKLKLNILDRDDVFHFREVFKKDLSKPLSNIISFDHSSRKVRIIEVSLKLSPATEDEVFWTTEFFEKRIKDFIMALNLARPGLVAVDEYIFIRSTGEVRTEKSVLESFSLTIERSSEWGWPDIGFLPIQKTWDWLMFFTFSLDVVSDSKMGRALNAFSFILFSSGGDNFGPQDLFWAVVGLESIYSEGSESVKRQVDEKSQLVLGKRNAFKKIFDEMYQFRSRFIHGDLDFPNHNLFSDGSDEFDKYFEKYNAATDLSLAMLIATIQKFIKEDWISVQFNFGFKGLGREIAHETTHKYAKKMISTDSD